MRFWLDKVKSVPQHTNGGAGVGGWGGGGIVPTLS
jgi:hypothetical protein